MRRAELVGCKSNDGAWTPRSFDVILAGMEESETFVTREEDKDEDGLGRRFWLRFVGGVVLVGVVLFVVLLIFWRALYAWGFLGVFLVVALAGLIFGWVYDRRNARRTSSYE